MSFKKYRQYPIVKNIVRQWPNNSITKAPIYCSVDLRDGNQALINPLSVEQKLEYFHYLVKMGFKHIEVSYPSASDTDFEFTRKIIEEDLVPDDVFIQVLIPARKELIQKSVKALRGTKKAIFHLYNPTNEFQRKVVFQKTDNQIIAMAVEGMQELKRLTADFEGEVMYEYTPESFSQTDLEFASQICNAVIDIVEPTQQNKMIINLPNTLEACMPNVYADRIEWMCANLNKRENILVSVHPHNDRGTAVASAEMAIIAGADRVEGTLFGNGERAGNLDLVTLAFNIYSQGIDPQIKLAFIDEVKEFIEKTTQIKTHIRHPYVGDMIFTAFSGGHQDAIKKGFDFYNKSDKKHWNVPYLPIDPKDIKRDYDKVVRINSQSGKSGVAFIISEFLGIDMPKDEAIKFGKIVKEESDKKGKELGKEEIINLYNKIKETNSWDPNRYKKHASFVSDLAMPVVELLNPQENENILDLGCGEGTLALEIKKSGADVIGVDLSKNMVEKTKTKGIDAFVMSATSLDFENQFDAIFSNAVLHWVKDSEIAIQKINKALKKDARFVAEFGGYGNIQNLMIAMEKVFNNNPSWGEFNSPWIFPKDTEYKELLEKNGFKVDYIELIQRPTQIDDITNWLDVFANGITENLSAEEKIKFKEEVTKLLKPIQYNEKDGWSADYVRLRVKAVKV
ncbi:MAG: 2-isopropylmalate synthase [Arcobacteraceae bacterium]|nr:2-isopropylmalate synthase [Arcobacteraceae bacterium]